MDEQFQRLLEEKWREQNAALQYTYRQWEAVRESDWKELLRKCRPSLTLRISPERYFYDALESKCVFTKRNIETFRVSRVLLFFHISVY